MICTLSAFLVAVYSFIVDLGLYGLDGYTKYRKKLKHVFKSIPEYAPGCV